MAGNAQLPFPGMGRTITKFEWRFDPPVPAFVFGLNRFADNISDFGPLFDVLHERFKLAMKSQFLTQGHYAGGEWHELTPKYERWKEQHYPGRPIGTLTGTFKKAMESDNSDHYYYRERSMAVMGLAEWASGDPRGRLHIYGPVFHHGRTVNGYQPPRQVIDFPSGEARQWQRESHKFSYWAWKNSLPTTGMQFVGGRTLGTAEKFLNMTLPSE